ncbi:MAG: N-acetylmuramoyl-L-alanine amidase [Bacteroidales bacterium]|nr:N-acetylmuramoyl-L-alanine amidase [Bacteroidales bacterium]MDT8374951.1 N-acetylmuramoyl-L-alanine amidase [Bacteroidales bacterium]
MMASITMPLTSWSQPVPEEKEWVMVIDAGHGGRDPGAVGSKAREKNINLAVALKTGNYIKQYLKDVKVIYTRDDDTFIGLDERAAIANRNKADLFISIHSNGMNDKRFIGTETYVMGSTRDEDNLKVVMKENSVITLEEDYRTKYEGYDPNSVESFIIFSLMQNTFLKQSTDFATLVQDQFRERVGRKDRGVKQGNLIVLWKSTMPSVLVELGFISNPTEEKFLISSEGQDYLASAIFRAFRDYKQSIDSRSGIRIDSSARTVAVPEAVSGSVSAGDAGVTADDIKSEAPDSSESKARDETVVEREPSKVEGQKSAGTSTGTSGVSDASAADEIFFMVQIAAMPGDRELSRDLLKNIDTVTRIKEGELTKYAAGRFPVYNDALKYRRILTLRFPDAFVIAVRNGRIMPLREAIQAKKTE